MSVELWPPISPEELKIALETTQSKELDWFLDELYETLDGLKHGLEDCYALLAPLDPGSTLVLSTPRNEIVKGHVTRVGTRIVKGNINLRLRTLPQQTLTINAEHPIHVAPLATVHSLLTSSIDLLNLTLSFSYPDKIASRTTSSPPAGTPIHSASFLAAQLRLLAQSLTEASALLKGPPLAAAADPAWTTRSIGPAHFFPPDANPINPVSPAGAGAGAKACPPLSFYLGVQDSSLVLWLRSLELADAPVHFGTKLALAIGTARRLEHDEAERVFGFSLGDGELGAGDHEVGGSRGGDGNSGEKKNGDVSATAGPRHAVGVDKREVVDVYVREKVRVESADPSLLSLSAKLAALGHSLDIARQNLAAVMGEQEPED